MIPLLIITLSIQHCLFFLSPATAASYYNNDQRDAAALLQLKANFILTTPSSDHPLSGNWTFAGTAGVCCNWVGVSCGRRHRRVTSLNLANMGIQGSLPPHLGNLSFLVSLDLSGNLLHGDLPDEISKLRRLKVINLAHNQFGGSIPPSLGDLSGLRVLDLEGNRLSGSIPATIFNISSLEIVVLANNSLSGSLPDDMCNQLGNIEVLKVSGNNLGGRIPSLLGRCSSLHTLSFSQNWLTGPIPTSVGNLTMLKALSFSFTNLTGEIPYEIGNLNRLQILRIQHIGISGVIPPIIFNISTLQELDLSANRLLGVLPHHLCYQVPNLTILYLDNNQIQGKIPVSIGNCSNLQAVALSSNQLSGSIPTTIGNNSLLRLLSLGDNILSGEIPPGLGNQLNALQFLHLGGNKLSGPIPWNIFNISSIYSVHLYGNKLSGSLPPTLGSQLPNLQTLNVWGNKLSGSIPPFIANASKLSILALEDNSFSGPAPDALANMELLQILSIGGHEKLVVEPSFLTSLTRCTRLKHLDISGTSFEGASLPGSIGNFSSLEGFIAQDCKIKGIIPDQVGNLSNINSISLSGNQLAGYIPKSMRQLRKLQGLDLGRNKLLGPIPNELCELQALGYLYLYYNNLSQEIPECVVNLTLLQHLRLELNKFNSTIPSSLWDMSSLLALHLGGNFLSGSVSPRVSNLKALYWMSLSGNYLSGDTPASIGTLVNLQELYLDQNQFQGPIPDSLANMIVLNSLDLSSNNLSGIIPKSMESLRDLKYFNISHNRLWGEIPSGGPFQNLSSELFQGNLGLCGLSKFGVPSCPQPKGKKSGHNKHFGKLLIVVLCLVFIATAILFVMIICCRQRKVDNRSKEREDLMPLQKWRRVSLLELQRATNGFDDCNLLGHGSFGRVYRGELADGTNVAVKVFNDLEEEEANNDTIDVDHECGILCNLRHRNLIRIISVCYTIDFRALVLEFMPNGSLNKWLYSHNYFLDISQRLKVVIDVASALEYLHKGYSVPIVHCDLKPENVLLDGDLVAHVSDFGISKLLGGIDSITRTLTLGTVGYIAPEYGGEGIVSVKSDVYSFGILLMEVFTRRKPTEESFDGGMDLKQWVTTLLPTRVTELADANLLADNARINITARVDCISSVMMLALACCTDTPEDRMDISDVLSNLKKIKSRILKPRRLRIQIDGGVDQ